MLPKDFDYYHIEYNDFYRTLKVSKHELDSVMKYSVSLEKKDRPWYHNKNIRVIESNKYHDWAVWHNKGYEREWFDFRDAYKFDDFCMDSEIHFADFSIIDDRRIGFYLIWKNFDDLI